MWLPLFNILAAVAIPVWTIETIIGLVGSLFIGAFFFWAGLRYRSKSQMAYQLHDFIVIGQPSIAALGDIKILFNDVSVPRVVVTQLAVWNTGNMVVKADETVKSDPLMICFEDGATILDAQRTSATQEVNDFRIKISEQDRSRAFLEFDYLNGGDGARFQIIHTGAKGKAKVTGSIRGIPKGVENWGDLQEWSERKSRLSNLFWGLATPVMGGLFITLMAWIKELIAPRYPVINKLTNWFVGAVLVLALLLLLFAVGSAITEGFYTRSRAAPKSLSRS